MLAIILCIGWPRRFASRGGQPDGAVDFVKRGIAL
jgi:hypothetical protein